MQDQELEQEQATRRFTMDVEPELYEAFKEACDLVPMTKMTRSLWQGFIDGQKIRKELDEQRAYSQDASNTHVAAGHS